MGVLLLPKLKLYGITLRALLQCNLECSTLHFYATIGSRYGGNCIYGSGTGMERELFYGAYCNNYRHTQVSRVM